MPQLLCLPLLRKLPGCTPTIPILVHPACPDFVGEPMQGECSALDSSSFFSHCCALFCTFLHSSKTQLFYFQANPNSFAKTPGGGAASMARSALRGGGGAQTKSGTERKKRWRGELPLAIEN